MTHYVAGVGFVEPEWKQIEDLRKMLKEMVFQFEGLVQYVSEEDFMDDELEALFVALLSDARKALEGKPIKPKIGGTVLTKLWKEDREALESILRIYGGHVKQCVRYYHKVKPCDCGWADVERSIKRSVPQDAERSGTE